MNDDLTLWVNGSDAYLEKASEENDPFKKFLDTPKLIELLGNVRGKSIIDIGSGNGDLVKILSEMGANVVGLEGSEKMINEGFWEKSYRNDIKRQLSELGARPVLYYMECSVEKMRERTVARSENPSKDSFEISGEMFDSYVKYWEPLTEDEEFVLAK